MDGRDGRLGLGKVGGSMVMVIGFEYILARFQPGTRFDWLPMQTGGKEAWKAWEVNGAIWLPPYLSRYIMSELVKREQGTGINGLPILNCSSKWLQVVLDETMDPACGELCLQNLMGFAGGVRGRHHGSMGLTAFIKLLDGTDRSRGGEIRSHEPQDTLYVEKLRARLQTLVTEAHQKEGPDIGTPGLLFRIPYYFNIWAFEKADPPTPTKTTRELVAALEEA